MIDILALALAASSPLLMSVGFFIWEDQWKGSAYALNIFKCTLAAMLFLLVSITVRGADGLRFAANHPRDVLFPLYLSSLYGIIVGDNAWLYALAAIGARKVILIDSIKPSMAVLCGHFLLGEGLTVFSGVGSVLSCLGVAAVCLEQHSAPASTNKAITTTTTTTTSTERGFSFEMLPSTSSHHADEHSIVPMEGTEGAEGGMDGAKIYDVEEGCEPAAPSTRALCLGYLAAAANVSLDVYGSVLTKQSGLDLNTFEINLLRFGFAAACMLLVSLLLWGLQAAAVAGMGMDKRTTMTGTRWYCLPNFDSQSLRQYAHVSGGVLLVTFFSPTLSNFALFRLPLGLALTVGSLGPLYALGYAVTVQREHVGAQAIAGTFVTVLGVCLLCWDK